MKLHAERTSRSGEKAASVLRPEAQPEAFFDFNRDVPAWLKRSLAEPTEAQALDDSGKVKYSLVTLRKMLGLDTVIDQGLIRQSFETLSIVGFSDMTLKDTDDSVKSPVGTLRMIQHLNEQNSFLLTPESKVLQANQAVRDLLEPSNVERQSGPYPDELVDLLYLGFTAFPDQRAAYSAVVRRQLEALLDFYTSTNPNQFSDGAYQSIAQISIMLPEAKEQLRSKMSHYIIQWKQHNADERFTSRFALPGLYCFMLLAQDEVGLDDRGRVWTKNSQPLILSKSEPLPPRSQL